MKRMKHVLTALLTCLVVSLSNGCGTLSDTTPSPPPGLCLIPEIPPAPKLEWVTIDADTLQLPTEDGRVLQAYFFDVTDTRLALEHCDYITLIRNY